MASDDAECDLGRRMRLGVDIVHVGLVCRAVHILKGDTERVRKDVELAVNADGDLEVFV